MGNPTEPVAGRGGSAEAVSRQVRAAAAGDPAAFAELYDAHAGRVFALCLRLSGDRGRAVELVQDVFLRVWERLEGFRGESSFSTWLHRVAVNVVLMEQRTESRRRRRVTLLGDVTRHGEMSHGVRDVGAPTARESSASARSTDPALAIDLERALARLPDVPRKVFVLHDVEGYSHDEIAALLDVPVGTSRSHLFRARRQLREELA